MSGPVTLDTALNAAVIAYWQRRPAQSRPTVIEHRRRQMRATTPAVIWLRRAGAT